MSIPKEPRQLMINLMYLVLTAMLALNVSAEIINAFFALDKGIDKNNTIIQSANDKAIEDMRETAKTKTQYAPLVTAAEQVKTITAEFSAYVDGVRDRMVEESGGKYTLEEAEGQGHPELEGKPKGKKDKDTPQRIFVSGDYGSEGQKPKVGPELAEKIKESRQKFKTFIESLWANGGIKATVFADASKKDAALAGLVAKFTMEGDENYDKTKHEGKEWSDYTFGHMPVAAIYPMLRKFQNDAKTTEAAIISYLASQMGKMELNYDKFDVFSQSPKSYILLGEEYNAEIALGAYSSQSKFSVSVNGGSLPIKEGKAAYKTRPTKVGEQKYSARISVQNPLTQETETFTKDFFFEVGQPSVTVSADKMNVFYIGVDNPITIAAAGISSNKVGVTIAGGGGSIKKQGKTSYVVKVAKVGEATINVKNQENGKSFPFTFRVKRIPDPVVRLGKKQDGIIKSGVMRAQPGLAAWLDNFDFEAKCSVQSYTMYYTRKRQDPVEIQGSGGRFSGKALNAIQAAKPGDQYAFVNVKARCPGDSAGRPVNGMSFQVK